MPLNVFDGKIRTGESTAAIVANRFVSINSGSTADKRKITQAGAGGVCAGVAVSAAAASLAVVSFAQDGEGLLECMGNSVNIVAGDKLKSDSSGRGVKAATNLDPYGAVALRPLTADSKKIRVTIHINRELSIA